MKTIAILVLCMIFLWGCSETKYMTNEEIIKEIKYCTDNWVGYHTIWNWRNYKVKYIICK